MTVFHGMKVNYHGMMVNYHGMMVNYHGMMVNYHGKKFYNIGPRLHAFLSKTIWHTDILDY
jgi:hypothetical protein